MAGDLPELMPSKLDPKTPRCYAPSVKVGRPTLTGSESHPYHLKDLARLLHMLRPNGKPTAGFKAAVGMLQLMELECLDVKDIRLAIITPERAVALTERTKATLKFWRAEVTAQRGVALKYEEEGAEEKAEEAREKAERLELLILDKVKARVDSVLEHFLLGGGIREVKISA